MDKIQGDRQEAQFSAERDELRRYVWRRRFQDESTWTLVQLQIRPHEHDSAQLRLHFLLEIPGVSVFRTDLLLQPLPGDPLRLFEPDDPVGEPHVQIESQGRLAQGRDRLHVQRHWMLDDLLEERLT